MKLQPTGRIPMPDGYRIFDTTLACDFPLPEVPGVSGPDPALYVSLAEGGPEQFDGEGFEVAYEWRNFSDRVVCWCERKAVANAAAEYLYVFPANASFHIAAGGSIRCFLHPGSSMQILRHLLLNQIIPRYLGTTGRLLLHAGAVTLANGRSVGFLGNSGFGKSTLVASFHRHGARLINDDCILLECSAQGVTAIGGLAGIRLFPDSVNAVFNEAAGFTNYTPYTNKQQLFLQREAGDRRPAPVVLDTMFLLNDPVVATAEAGDAAADAISIEPASGSEGMIAMISMCFSLDPSDRQMIVRNFRNVGQAVSERLSINKLHYPREHGRLGEVRAAVVDWLG